MDAAHEPERKQERKSSSNSVGDPCFVEHCSIFCVFVSWLEPVTAAYSGASAPEFEAETQSRLRPWSSNVLPHHLLTCVELNLPVWAQTVSLECNFDICWV